MVQQPGFLGEHGIARADVQPAFGHVVISRDHRGDAVQIAFDHGGRFDVVLDAFHADPDARIAREGEAIEAIVDELLHPCGMQDRDHDVEQVKFGLVA